MSRDLKRVPLDFDWPLKKIWAGYVDPFYAATDCPHCGGTGYSKEARALHDQWYGNIAFDPKSTGSIPVTPDNPWIVARAEKSAADMKDMTLLMMIRLYGVVSGNVAELEAQRLCDLFNSAWCHHLDQDDVNALWAADRLYDFNPKWRENKGNAGIPPPSAAEVNQWSIQRLGHDGLNSGICIREKAKRLGLPYHCSNCKGEARVWPSQAMKALSDAWENIEPPTGEGYQVWETVSEGSPISPVFATEDQLIGWLLDQGYSEGAAEQFAKQGNAPSMVSVTTSEGTRTYNDIESLNAPPSGE